MDLDSNTRSQPRPTTPSLSIEGDLLSPEWYAAFTIYWRAKSRQERSQTLAAIRAAIDSPTPEHVICRLQRALRDLGLVDVQIIKLILVRYVHHIRQCTDNPARRIAEEVLDTLSCLRAPRTRKPKRNSVKRATDEGTMGNDEGR